MDSMTWVFRLVKTIIEKEAAIRDSRHSAGDAGEEDNDVRFGGCVEWRGYTSRL